MSDTVLDGQAIYLSNAKLPTPRTSVSPVCVIRGDLTSVTGYGQATRSLAALIRGSFELYGVDIHREPGAERASFPGQLIDDEAVLDMLARPGAKVFVLNYTPPSYFRYFPFAVNIGCFYWETSALSFPDHWRELIVGMDYMWAPSAYVADLIRGGGFSRPVYLITWPHNFSTQPSSPEILNGVEAHFIDRFQGDEGVTLPVEAVRERGRSIFLSVKSAAPRKGLPVLLTEWRDHVLAGRTEDILFLKLRLVHNSRLRAGNAEHMVEMIREAGFQQGEKTRIAFIVDDLTDPQLNALYRLADAYVTASYGEGFGGPVVEALLIGTPVIAPRHTGMAELLPVDYPLAFRSDLKTVQLRGNSSIYPHASTWEIPRRGEIKNALARFDDLGHAERTAIARDARAHAEAFCSQWAVSAQMSAFFDDIDL